MLYVFLLNACQTVRGYEALDSIKVSLINVKKGNQIIPSIIKKYPVEVLNSLANRHLIDDDNEESEINQKFQLFLNDYEKMKADNDKKKYVEEKFDFVYELIDESMKHYGDFIKVFKYTDKGFMKEIESF